MKTTLWSWYSLFTSLWALEIELKSPGLTCVWQAPWPTKPSCQPSTEEVFKKVTYKGCPMCLGLLGSRQVVLTWPTCSFGSFLDSCPLHLKSPSRAFGQVLCSPSKCPLFKKPIAAVVNLPVLTLHRSQKHIFTAVVGFSEAFVTCWPALLTALYVRRLSAPSYSPLTQVVLALKNPTALLSRRPTIL